MKIIAIVNQKGGVGKTTIATNFACIFAANNKQAILIDSDSQGSSMKFRACRKDDFPQFQAVSILTPTIHKDIKAFQGDYIIIDAGGRDSQASRSSIVAASAVLIPLLPSQYDLWSSEETFKQIEEVRTFNDKLKVGAVLNQVIAGTTISREVQEVMNEFIVKYKLKLFDSKLFSRVAYKESVTEGLAVTEINNPKYEKARDEMLNLYNEVIEWL